MRRVIVDPGTVEPTVEPPSLADLSGWPLDSRERGDFYHVPRVFPTDVRAWRERLVRKILEDPGRFRTVSHTMGVEDIRAGVDAGIAYLREIARILAALHGTPRLGNKTEPVDELVYIILARKTREDAYQKSFTALKSQFACWDDLLEAPKDVVTRLVHAGGLSGKKTASLYGALGALRAAFGSCTLEPTRDWSDDQLEKFLCSLPEISRKSAYCIMMYALGRQVFPADTHVGRILARLRPYRELGLSLAGLDHKKLQTELAGLIPPNLRYSLHVNLVAHGRTVCRAVWLMCR